MIEKYFSMGDRIELQPVKRKKLTEETQQEPPKIYISKINRILDDDKIEILMPIALSKIVLLPKNAIYNVTVYTAKKGLYKCDVKVAERYKSDNIYLQVLELVSGIKKHQRREFYRYDASLSMFCRRLEDREKQNQVWDEHLPGAEGITIDIGGGGIRFLIEEEFSPDELVVCGIKLEFKNGVREIQALGKVLSSKPVSNTGKKEVRVQFEIISATAREDIIQYIFEDERKRRKNSGGLRG